jgi:hypothetical protein
VARAGPWFGTIDGNTIEFSIPVPTRPYLTGTIEGDRIPVRLEYHHPFDPCSVSIPPWVGELRRISCAGGAASFSSGAP